MSETQNMEVSTDDFSPVRIRSSRAKEKGKVNEVLQSRTRETMRSNQKLARKLTMNIYQIRRYVVLQNQKGRGKANGIALQRAQGENLLRREKLLN